MYCKECGKEIENGKEYCAECEAARNTTTATGTENVVNQNTNATQTQKSKMAAGLLGIFLGAFGVHNFYLGYTGKAVAQLLITLLSCFTLSIVSEIWGLIEGIMLLSGSITTDASGNPLKE
ncbi:MAG: TM2 domain-containing protein [Clostridia bacterium]|nr:TM2 domain-containing protein [Clostridia bacterium]